MPALETSAKASGVQHADTENVCWCEETKARMAKDISDKNKQKIELAEEFKRRQKAAKASKA